MLFEMATSIRRRPVHSLGGAAREALLTAFQLTLLFLLILGIGGISYQGVSPNGWLLRLLDSAWDRGPSYLFFTALGIVAGGTWLHKIMHRSPAIASGTGDAIAGGFIALGIFFCARFLYSGSL